MSGLGEYGTPAPAPHAPPATVVQVTYGPPPPGYAPVQPPPPGMYMAPGMAPPAYAPAGYPPPHPIAAGQMPPMAPSGPGPLGYAGPSQAPTAPEAPRDFVEEQLRLLMKSELLEPGSLERIQVRRISRLDIDYATHRTFDAEEAARAVAEEKEFRAWMQFVGLGQFANSCVAAGYGSLETIQMRNDTELDEWATSCNIPTGFHRRLRDKRATIEGFRRAFQAEQAGELAARRRRLMEEMEAARRAEQERLEREAIHKACTAEVEDLGLAWKRGVQRTEKWRQRHFVLYAGSLSYYEPESFFTAKFSKYRGGSRLTKATLTKAPVSAYADRGTCLDLAVASPCVRTFLISLDDERALPRWQEAIERHTKFCAYFPDEVRNPDATPTLRR